MTPDDVAALKLAHPDLSSIELVFPDMNGVARGKHLPANQSDKLFGKVRLPLATYNIDILSLDTEAAGIAIERGDPDGYCHVVAGGPALWSGGRHAVALMTMTTPEGAPNPYDPRQVLARVLEQFTAAGLTPVVAPELEFYLLDATRDATGRAQPPLSPVTGERLSDPQVYRLSVLDPFMPIMDDIRAACHALGVAAETASAEFGPGQFEINLGHTADALSAADQAVLLKHAIRGVARQHGMEACFMAKPYGEESGSGLHFHISLLNADGENVFTGVTADQLNEPLSGAVARLKNTMAEAMLVFAPHLNSFRRLAPGTYAPMVAAWGFDNRGVALRVPTTTGPAARVEHRTAGADANPYLVLAALLQAIFDGLGGGDPGPPAHTEATEADGPVLPLGWGRAIAAFEESAFVKRALGSEFARVYALMKRQEMERLRTRVTDVEFDVYMRSV
ncbi:MAG: glutamine synthetase family protein [Pseudomonadota bacterium]